MLKLMISFSVLKLVRSFKDIPVVIFLDASTYLNLKYNAYHHFFSYRIISVWNLLPESIVLSSTLAAFKTRLKKFDLHDICHLMY